MTTVSGTPKLEVGDSVAPAFRDRAAAALEVMQASGAFAEHRWSVSALTQLEGGWSRHSFALGLDGPGGGREYIVRMKPPGTLLETDLAQEFRTYVLLEDEPMPTPRVYGLEESADNPFGGPFFVMDRLPGRSPNVWRRRDRERLERDWSEGGSLARELVGHLVAIHRVAPDRVQPIVQGFDYHSLVEHWRGVQEEVRLVRDPVVEAAYAWLLEREPPPNEPALVHGDYRVGNCLIDRGRITGILDWELAFFGDPRFDLGYVSLEYLAGKFLEPTSRLLGAVADRDWFLSEYERLSGRAVDREVVHTFSVLGALMLIAILATGVREYSRGHTSDVRMAWSRFAIPGLRQDLTHLMAW